MASDADAYERGVKISQTSLTPNFREGVQANPWFQLGYQMGLKHGARAAGMMSRAKSEFPAVAARLQASRFGTPARFAVEDRFYFGKGRKERFASKEQALAFIKQYKRNEDSNAHSENVVLLAKFMGNSRAAKLASLVQQINEVAGHMPHGVGQFQYNELHAPLWKQFIAQYGDLYASVK